MAVTNQNRIIRKLIVAFGNLFNNITLVRYDQNQSEQERFLVPLTYAPKELYVQRLEADPDLTKKVQMTLPRMSYEMMGLSYDASRKQNTNIKNFAQSNTLLSQYNPVPYNFDFELSVYTRNHEDVHSIVECIMPFFTPDYTINVNMIPEMGIVKEIPIILNNTNREVVYDGNRDADPRLIIWTFNFTVKGFIFGNVTSNSGGLILNSITHIYNEITPNDVIQFNLDPSSGLGNYKVGEFVYQGYTFQSAIATAQIVSYDPINFLLSVKNMDGNFVSSMMLIGSQTGAAYNFTSSTMNNALLSTISVTPAVNINLFDETANNIISEVANLDIIVPVDVYDYKQYANVANTYTINTKITE